MHYRHWRLPLLCALTALLATTGAFAQSTLRVTGRVFDDANANGKLDAGEKGIAGVRVSDMLRVVRSGRDGVYAIDNVNPESCRFVYVVTPSGRRASSGFYRALPTDKAQFEADFALAPWSESANRRFTFAQVTDIHVVGDSDSEDLSADLAEIAGCGAAFVLASGDLVNDGVKKPEQLDNYVNGIRKSTIPVYNGPGNHDVGGKGESPENYEKMLGPVYYSFDFGGCHFAAINSTNYGDVHRQWLINDLREAKGAPVIAFQHYHPNREILRTLAAYNGLVLFSGHWHTTKVFPFLPSDDAKSPIMYVNTPPLRFGGIDTSARGFVLAHVDNGKLRLEQRYGGVKRHVVLAAPADGAQVAAGALDIIVAAYDSAAPSANVEYSLDNGPWQPMARSGSLSYSARERVGAGDHTVSVRARFVDCVPIEKQAKITATSGSAAMPRTGDDWPMFKHDAERTGLSADAVKPPLRLAWSSALGGTIHVGGAVVDGDTVYVGIADDGCSGKSGVCALNVSDGKVKWRQFTSGAVKNAVAVADGNVYALTIDGKVIALDAETGEPGFSHQMDEVGRWLFGAPVVRDQVLYAGSGAELIAIDTRTGRKIWTAGKMGGDWISCYTSPVCGKGTVLMGLNWGTGLWGLDRRTGEPRWNAKDGFGTSHCTPALSGNRVYHAANSSLHAVDAWTSDVLWSSPLRGGWPLSSPAVCGDKVVVGGPNGNICCVDAATGKEIWSTPTGTEILYYQPYARSGRPVISSPAVSGGVAYCGGVDGKFYALDMNDGKVLWSYDLGVPVTAAPAVSGNAVYACAYDGTVYAFVQAD